MALSSLMEKAIKENDLTTIYSSFYTILLSDPGFANGRFDQTLDELKRCSVEGLFQPYDGKEFKRCEDWNQQYWDNVASELMDNFCMERIEHLKAISRVLYPTNKKAIDEIDNLKKEQLEYQKKNIELIHSSKYKMSLNLAKMIAIITIILIVLIMTLVLVM